MKLIKNVILPCLHSSLLLMVIISIGCVQCDQFNQPNLEFKTRLNAIYSSPRAREDKRPFSHKNVVLSGKTVPTLLNGNLLKSIRSSSKLRPMHGLSAKLSANQIGSNLSAKLSANQIGSNLSAKLSANQIGSNLSAKLRSNSNLRSRRQIDPSVPMNVIKGITQGTTISNIGQTFQTIVNNMMRLSSQLRVIGSRLGERLG